MKAVTIVGANGKPRLCHFNPWITPGVPGDQPHPELYPLALTFAQMYALEWRIRNIRLDDGVELQGSIGVQVQVLTGPPGQGVPGTPPVNYGIPNWPWTFDPATGTFSAPDGVNIDDERFRIRRHGFCSGSAFATGAGTDGDGNVAFGALGTLNIGTYDPPILAPNPNQTGTVDGSFSGSVRCLYDEDTDRYYPLIYLSRATWAIVGLEGSSGVNVAFDIGSVPQPDMLAQSYQMDFFGWGLVQLYNTDPYPLIDGPLVGTAFLNASVLPIIGGRWWAFANPDGSDPVRDSVTGAELQPARFVTTPV